VHTVAGETSSHPSGQFKQVAATSEHYLQLVLHRAHTVAYV